MLGKNKLAEKRHLLVYGATLVTFLIICSLLIGQLLGHPARSLTYSASMEYVDAAKQKSVQVDHEHDKLKLTIYLGKELANHSLNVADDGVRLETKDGRRTISVHAVHHQTDLLDDPPLNSSLKINILDRLKPGTYEIKVRLVEIVGGPTSKQRVLNTDMLSDDITIR